VGILIHPLLFPVNQIVLRRLTPEKRDSRRLIRECVQQRLVPRSGLLAHLRLVTLHPPEGRKIVAQPTRKSVVHFPGPTLAL